MAPPDFGRSVNPISTRGADYADHISTCTPRIFIPSYGPDCTLLIVENVVQKQWLLQKLWTLQKT